MGDGDRPVLWHIPISHYSEKVRWALDHKGVSHDRRTPNPHPPVALALTRGKHATLPVMRIDSRTIGDSSAIIAALEESHPEPPLYPADPGDRQRALELEEWFDEEAGPPVRLLAWHEVTRDKAARGAFASRYGPPPLRRAGPVAEAVMSAFVSVRYGVHSKSAAEAARQRVPAAFDRLEHELGDGDYFVGDSFTVADLTAASLLYPIVTPAEAPELPDPPPALDEFRAGLRERRGYRWVEEMYRRHRGASRREPASTTAPRSA